MYQLTHRNGGRALWIAALPATSLLASLIFACAMPFTAIAAIAATRMRARDGALTVTIAWAANQVIGFALLGYPDDPYTLGWGPALLGATLSAFVTGRIVFARMAAQRTAIATMAAFLAGFATFKIALIGCSLLLGGLDIATSPYWTARQLLIDGSFCLGLLALYEIALAAGLPAARKVVARA